MRGLIAVSVAPFALAMVLGVGGFGALLPLLLTDTPERRRREGDGAPTAVVEVPAVTIPGFSRLRRAVTMGAVVAWSVWSVRRPRHP